MWIAGVFIALAFTGLSIYCYGEERRRAKGTIGRTVARVVGLMSYALAIAFLIYTVIA